MDKNAELDTQEVAADGANAQLHCVLSNDSKSWLLEVGSDMIQTI